MILTTHILDVAERLAERIGIIQNGKLIAEGTLDELRSQTSHSVNGVTDANGVVSRAATLEEVFLQLTEPA